MADRYGSDIVIDMLRDLGIDFAAINPGASFRGLHASLANAKAPQLVLALQENIAVAVGHGYAKSAGRPMAVFLHDLVGLQSGAMGIFNAWVDQAPIMLIGGSGPADTTFRRPWIDWVHSCRMQSLVVRDYVKWDDQPASLTSIPSSLARAHALALAAPTGPTYVAVDVELQEQRLSGEAAESLAAEVNALTKQSRGRSSVTVPQDDLDDLADLLVRASNPVILADYTGSSRAGYDALTELAEALAAPVVDLGARHNFPNDHWADCTDIRPQVLAEADLVLCLDVRDINFAIAATTHDSHGYRRLTPTGAHIVSISMNQLLQSGFLDYSPHVADATELTGDTAVCLPVLARLVGERAGDRGDRREALTNRTTARRRELGAQRSSATAGPPGVAALSSAVHRSVSGGPWELANGHLRGHVRGQWILNRFNAHLGQNVGAGLGYGIGVSIGAALAHRDDGTMIVNLQNDGDLMYAPAGLWTAARYRLPILTVMVNNRTYAQDRMHQAIIAKERGYPAETATVGIDLDDPAIDFAGLARAQGVEAWGPVTDLGDLDAALALAVRTVRNERRPALVDVVVSGD